MTDPAFVFVVVFPLFGQGTLFKNVFASVRIYSTENETAVSTRK